MQWNQSLAWAAMQKKTYINESAVRLLGKSWYERGELFQQWSHRLKMFILLQTKYWT